MSDSLERLKGREQKQTMTLLLSTNQNHIVLNSRCSHVGVMAVAVLIELYGGLVLIDAEGRAARCSRCYTNGIIDMQIVYVGDNNEAMRSAGQANSNYKFKK